MHQNLRYCGGAEVTCQPVSQALTESNSKKLFAVWKGVKKRIFFFENLFPQKPQWKKHASKCKGLVLFSKFQSSSFPWENCHFCRLINPLVKDLHTLSAKSVQPSFKLRGLLLTLEDMQDPGAWAAVGWEQPECFPGFPMDSPWTGPHALLSPNFQVISCLM